MKERGVFLSFEGIEGTGKSTQAGLLFDFLNERRLPVLLTAEPGGTPIGQKIRELLLSVEHGEMDPMTELLLYAASRRQHIQEVIVPSLENGLIVITDRFSDSTRAYQGYGRGIDLKLIEQLDNIVTGRLAPDLTLLLDIDVKAGLMRNRKINKLDRLELEDISFHERVREGYLLIRDSEPQRVRLINASGGIEAVHATVSATVMEFLARRGISPA